MRVPLPWLAEYAALPAGATGRAGRRRPGHGSASRRRASTAAASPARSSSAGSSTFVEEPQKNGKTIRWCRSTSALNVGRTDAAARHRLRRAQLRRRRQVVVVLPGAVLPGGFADRRPQDLRPRLRRHDLLGPRAGPGRRPRRDHPARRAGAGRGPRRAPTRSRCSAWASRPSRSTSPPTAATRLSVRGVAREYAPATGAAFTDPAAVDAARGRRTTASRCGSTDDAPIRGAPAATATSRASCAGSTPPRPSPALDAAPARAGRHAPDLARRRRDQLRDARARPAAARLRPRRGSVGRSSSAGPGPGRS